ncbi:hypothetical protein [Streptomyces camelliae]|uniref:Oxidoreductase n=1 Tax=Streptomyces camelliae TaxID=3004093 RepID=A0ABY7NXH4_9ACTN|nr:hypothetical protein [Streptomyces sp. HUAS 2-6]WBO61798.1 hypothetical protein O1G22_02525 [Streptomyces sp. HUAS 2-6]
MVDLSGVLLLTARPERVTGDPVRRAPTATGGGHGGGRHGQGRERSQERYEQIVAELRDVVEQQTKGQFLIGDRVLEIEPMQLLGGTARGGSRRGTADGAPGALHAGGGVELVDCFVPDGLNLCDSRLPGLVLDGSCFGHPAGSHDPPVDAARFTAPAMTLRGAVANADTPSGAVRFLGAHLGLLDCDGARLENTSGPALHADGLRVDRAVFLRAGFRATGAGHSVLALNGVSVGSLWLDTSGVTRSGQAAGALVGIEGLTYADLPAPVGLSRWLELLRDHTPGYSAQPYQQLAAVHRAAGHDSEVRDILMAQRRDQIDRGGLRRRDRAWARFTGLALGFGYQPWRALLLLFAVLAGSVALAVVLGGPGGGLEHTARASTPTTPCTVVERVGVGLDLGLPVVKTGAGDLYAPTGTRAGQTLTVAGWLLQLAAWASATLFIAGFTGAVRKT